MQRFLIVNMPRARLTPGRAPDRDAQSGMFEAIRRMMSREEGVFTPAFRFSPEADGFRRQVAEFAYALGGQLDTPIPLRGWLEKLEGEWARIALVFHFLDWATGPGAVEVTQFPDEVISADIAERAARFLLEFQYPHQAHFYRKVANLGSAADEDVLQIAGYILANNCSAIDERTVARIRSNTLAGEEKRPQRLAALDTLERNGWLLPAGLHRSKGHVNKWTVNPAVHTLFAAQAAIEREKRSADASIRAEAFAARRKEKAA
jgi:hypothetical protein